MVNTLPRCYSTVRALMNSWAPISGLVRPSLASRAICASCAVSSPRVVTERLRTVSPVAEQLTAGALGEPLHAHRAVQLVGDAQLLAGVDSPVLAAQPFAVEQMGAGERHTDAGAAEPLDRLAVEAFGRLALAQQRSRARLDPQRPVRAARRG